MPVQLQELLREIRVDDATGSVQASVEQLAAVLMGLPRREVLLVLLQPV